MIFGQKPLNSSSEGGTGPVGSGFRSHLHTVPVEPAGVAGRTLEDGIGQDRVDGVQTDGAGLRQTDVGPGGDGLGGAVIPAVGPEHTDTN